MTKGGRIEKVKCYVCGKVFETSDAGTPEIESRNIFVKGKNVKVQEEIRYLGENGDAIELYAGCKKRLFQRTAGF